MATKREKLAKAIALRQQKMDDLTRLNVIFDELEDILGGWDWKNEIPRMLKVAPKVLALKSESERIIKRNDLSNSKEYSKILDPFAELYRIKVGMINDVNRIVKIELHKSQQRRQPTKMEGSKCVKCGKPAHFDEYCKRCANELGIRPSGKI